MKNLFAAVPLFLLLLSLPACTQPSAIDAFYDDFRNGQDVTNVQLQGWMVRLAARFADDETAQVVARKISRLHVMVIGQGDRVSPEQYAKLLQGVRGEAFDDLMEVRDKGKRVQLLLREGKEAITDVLVLIRSDQEFILLSIEGKLKFDDLHQLKLDVEGSEYLECVPAKKSALPRA